MNDLLLPGMLPGIPDPGPMTCERRNCVPMRRLEFFVAGEPKPMGSKTAFVVKGQFGPRAVVTDGKAAKPMRAWKDSVVAAAMLEQEGQPGAGGVGVELVFYLRRPDGHYTPKGELRRSAPPHCSVRPDADKLARSTLDALTESGIIADDARIVDLVVRKRYAERGRATGARIVVEEL